MREQRVDAGAERRKLRRVQRLGRGDAVRCGALRVLKRLQIHLQAGHFEQRQTVLTVPEEIARAALRQVRFCNFEAVVRGAEGFQPRLRLGIAVRRKEHAVGLRIPAPDAVIYLAVDPEVSQRLITERYHGDESKKDIQEKDTEYLARSRAAAEYCARTLGWHRIECTTADANGAKSMRSVEDINAEILAELAGIL